MIIDHYIIFYKFFRTELFVKSSEGSEASIFSGETIIKSHFSPLTFQKKAVKLDSENSRI